MYIFKQKCKKSKNTLENLIAQQSKLQELGVEIGKHDTSEDTDYLDTKVVPPTSDANTSGRGITHFFKSEFQQEKTCFPCEICNKNYMNPWGLGKHCKQVHNPPGLPCDKCPMLFYHPSHLEHHLEKGHPEKPENSDEPNEWLCETCGSNFFDKILYKNHMDNHIYGVKPHACNECYKSFNSRQNLKWHIEAIHLKIKNFECSECSAMFYFKSDFQRHYQSRHLKIKPEKGKSFRNLNPVEEVFIS